MVRKRKTKGSSMLLVIAIFGILSIVGTSMLAATTANYKMRISENSRVKNLYIAESGLDMAYVKLVNEVDNAIKVGYDATEGNFISEYNKYVLNELPNKVTGKYMLSNNTQEVDVKCTVTEKSETTKEAILESTYMDNGNERIVNVTYTINTPTVTITTEGDISNITKYSIATDGDLKITDSKTSSPGSSNSINVNGNLWVQGRMGLRESVLLLADKYKGGIIVTNSNIKLNGDIATASNLAMYDSEVTFNEAGEKNVFAENIFVGNNPGKAYITENKFYAIKDNVYLANDLVIDCDNADVEIGNYYGFNDVNLVDDMGNMVRGSSSIIINSIDWPKINTNAKLKISESAYIMGAAYINTKTPYQTGESVALKGNYEAYTEPVEGKYDKSQYEYLDPLVLINKKIVEETDKDGKTTSKYEDLSIQDKANHFVEYTNKYGSDKERNIRLSGIELPQNTFTAGAYISNDKANGWRDPMVNTSVINGFKSEFVKAVYYMGTEKNGTSYGDNEFYRKQIEYKDKERTIPLYTVNGQINWENVEKIIKVDNDKSYKIIPSNKLNRELNVILNFDENTTIAIEKASENQNSNSALKVKINDVSVNDNIKKNDETLIITKGKVEFNKLNGMKVTVLAVGDIAINGCISNIGSDSNILDLIDGTIIEPVFTPDSESSTEVGTSAQSLITKEKWTLVK